MRSSLEKLKPAADIVGNRLIIFFLIYQCLCQNIILIARQEKIKNAKTRKNDHLVKNIFTVSCFSVSPSSATSSSVTGLLTIMLPVFSSSLCFLKYKMIATKAAIPMIIDPIQKIISNLSNADSESLSAKYTSITAQELFAICIIVDGIIDFDLYVIYPRRSPSRNALKNCEMFRWNIPKINADAKIPNSGDI